MKQKLYNALKARYEAQKSESLATLSVYLNNAVGIGEHPQIIDEMDKKVEQYANAEDCINALEEIRVSVEDQYN
tara:strand:- start:372 stop:593 length:222 start_codon:yes stop_codon:yes gene_type:complete